MLALPCLMEPPHSSSFITEEGARRRVTFSLGPVCIWRKSSCLSLSLVYFLCPWDILLNSHLTSINPVSKFSLLPVPTLLPIKICFYLSKVSLSPKFYSRNFDSVTYFFFINCICSWQFDTWIHVFWLRSPTTLVSLSPGSCLIFFWDPLSLTRAFSVNLGLERSIGITSGYTGSNAHTSPGSISSQQFSWEEVGPVALSLILISWWQSQSWADPLQAAYLPPSGSAQSLDCFEVSGM